MDGVAPACQSSSNRATTLSSRDHASLDSRLPCSDRCAMAVLVAEGAKTRTPRLPQWLFVSANPNKPSRRGQGESSSSHRGRRTCHPVACRVGGGACGGGEPA